jgi:hypothetical protein
MWTNDETIFGDVIQMFLYPIRTSSNKVLQLNCKYHCAVKQQINYASSYANTVTVSKYSKLIT